MEAVELVKRVPFQVNANPLLKDYVKVTASFTQVERSESI